jgi:hypothetical protein
MADWAVSVLKKGWAGNIRRNTVLATGTNADTLSPALVGLHQIHAVVPSGRSGSIGGATCAATGAANYTGTALSLFTAATSPAAFDNSSAELFVYGV